MCSATHLGRTWGDAAGVGVTGGWREGEALWLAKEFTRHGTAGAMRGRTSWMGTWFHIGLGQERHVSAG